MREREKNLQLEPLIMADAEYSDFLHPQTLWRSTHCSAGPGQSSELHLFIYSSLGPTQDDAHDSLVFLFFLDTSLKSPLEDSWVSAAD